MISVIPPLLISCTVNVDFFFAAAREQDDNELLADCLPSTYKKKTTVHARTHVSVSTGFKSKKILRFPGTFKNQKIHFQGAHAMVNLGLFSPFSTQCKSRQLRDAQEQQCTIFR